MIVRVPYCSISIGVQTRENFERNSCLQNHNFLRKKVPVIDYLGEVDFHGGLIPGPAGAAGIQLEKGARELCWALRQLWTAVRATIG